MRRPFPIAACTPPDVTRLDDSPDGLSRRYSHSMINDTFDLLIRRVVRAAAKPFAVISTVKCEASALAQVCGQFHRLLGRT